MFIAFLKYSTNKTAASEHMPDHGKWISQGFEDGIFHLAGALDNDAGGFIIAHGESRDAFEARIQADPLVVHQVVDAEIHEIDPKKTTQALEFLKA